MKELYEIKIPIFSGPFDLLLSLIKEQEIDIYDIPIVLITSQYLQYLELMKELNLDIAGEFIVIASTLIYLKSKTLLPLDEQLEDNEDADPRLELVQQLIEYQSFKEAALALKERQDEFSAIFYRLPGVWDQIALNIQNDSQINDQDISHNSELKILMPISIYDLVSAFSRVLKGCVQSFGHINRETLTVRDMISIITQRLEGEIKLNFLTLFIERSSRIERIVVFLALLEILKLGLASVKQEGTFGNIVIIKK